MDAPVAFGQPTTQEVYELITELISYENVAREQGIDLSSGQFKDLSMPEKRLIRADLISDYIRLAIRRLDPSRTDFEPALEDFCGKLLEMEVPSIELMGTFLAALDIVAQDDRLNHLQPLRKALCETMVTALQKCTQTLRARASSSCVS
ncbi:MAG: hypothetical protein ACUVRS_05525 [Armatimonadota bacterium]